ncbi:MAG: hypothetical protein AAF568_13125 [Pseudomonadota bacterium]
MEFDPLTHVENAAEISDEAGLWPNFHDAIINEIHVDRGDIRPEDDVWIGISVTVGLTICAYRDPFAVRLTFFDCSEVHLGNSGQVAEPEIYDLIFRLEPRGYFSDEKTPLPPHICVEFQEGCGIVLQFKYFRVRAERLPGPPRL